MYLEGRTYTKEAMVGNKGVFTTAPYKFFLFGYNSAIVS